MCYSVHVVHRLRLACSGRCSNLASTGLASVRRWHRTPGASCTVRIEVEYWRVGFGSCLSNGLERLMGDGSG